ATGNAGELPDVPDPVAHVCGAGAEGAPECFRLCFLFLVLQHGAATRLCDRIPAGGFPENEKMGYQVAVSTRIWRKAAVGAVHAARLRDGCRACVLALLLGRSAAACAQLLGQPGAAGMITARWHASKDTDDFSVRRAAVGYLWNKGWGLEARTSHYSAPGWDASGTAVSGVYHSQTKERVLGAR